MDDRLDQQVTITEPGDRLAAVLERLSKKTGVKLVAEAPMRDTVVVVRHDGTLKGLMDALSHFFGAGKDQQAYWIFPRVTPPLYELTRSAGTVAAIGFLRNERQKALIAAMDQAVRDDNQWVRHLASLTDQERRAIYSGGQVMRNADHFGGEPFLKEVLLRDRPNWSDNVRVTYSMAGASPLSRWLLRRLDDQQRPGYATEGWPVEKICPQFAPARQQVEWRQRYGDPAPIDRTRVAFRQKDEQRLGGVPRREVLLTLAERAKVNLIADDCGQIVSVDNFPDNGGLSALLDEACAPSYASDHNNPGSFWRKAADVYLVRSLAWPEEEVQ